MTRPHLRRGAGQGIVALLALAAGAVVCSSGDDSTAKAPTNETPTTTSADDTVVGDGEPWVVFHGVELGLTLARVDGTGLHTILEGETVHPDWSPDGSEIAYVHTGQVWITDPAGEHPRRLVETLPTGLDGLYWEDPAWSRDGARIATVGYDGNPNDVAPARSVLAIVDVATSEVTVAGELTLADGNLHSFPRWSPAGDALVMNVDHFTGETYDGATVAVARADGESWTAPEPITELGQYGKVDWHPTDDLIVFGDYDISGHQDTDEPTNLFTIRTDGSQLTPVTDFGPERGARGPADLDRRRPHHVRLHHRRHRRRSGHRDHRHRRLEPRDRPRPRRGRQAQPPPPPPPPDGARMNRGRPSRTARCTHRRMPKSAASVQAA